MQELFTHSCPLLVFEAFQGVEKQPGRTVRTQVSPQINLAFTSWHKPRSQSTMLSIKWYAPCADQVDRIGWYSLEGDDEMLLRGWMPSCTRVQWFLRKRMDSTEPCCGGPRWRRMEYDRAREVELELSHARGGAGEALVGWLLVGHTAEVANLSCSRLIRSYEFELTWVRFEVE